MTVCYRYAIYYSPQIMTELGRFGASWLGRTPEGQDLAPPVCQFVDEETWTTAVEAPRRYGFHATLKAPFRLADGVKEIDLLDAVEGFISAQDKVTLGPLQLAERYGFLALLPKKHAGVSRFAAKIVHEFNQFRAPLTAQEIEHRKTSELTRQQRGLLETWGYPYVMGEFLFHMTLTGKLNPENAMPLQKEIEKRISPSVLGDVSIDEICVFVEQNPGDDLVLTERFKFGG